MQKIVTPNSSRSAGAMLINKVSPGTLGKLHRAAASVQQRPADGPYDSFIKATKDAQAVKVPTAGTKATILTVKPPAMRASQEELAHGDGLDMAIPAQAHTRQLRETAAAHAALLASFKAVYAGPPVNPSHGPVAL